MPCAAAWVSSARIPIVAAMMTNSVVAIRRREIVVMGGVLGDAKFASGVDC